MARTLDTIDTHWITRLACVIALLWFATGCTTAPSRTAAVTFVVVRHAEKATDDPRDPSLSTAGMARAQALATLIPDGPVVAAYATRYRRTQLTAEPTARAAGINVTTYDADLPAEAVARQLRDTHAHGTVLVVGHSNTAPGIAAALCACEVPPMADDAFNIIHRIDIHPGDAPVLRSSTY